MTDGFDYDNIVAELGLSSSPPGCLYNDLYRVPSAKGGLEPETLSNSRQEAKKEFIEEQEKQELRYAARFQEIKKQVEAEMLAERQQKSAESREKRLIETHGMLNERLVRELREQTTREIEAARSRELEAKLGISMVQRNLKTSVKAFSGLISRHREISTALEVLIKADQRWQSRVVLYKLRLALEMRREWEREERARIREELAENKRKQAEDVYAFRLQQKLFRLIFELSKYTEYEKAASLEKERRIAKINAFVEKIETAPVDPPKPISPAPQSIPKPERAHEEVEHQGDAIAVPSEDNIIPEADKRSKSYKPYVAPPKPRFLMQMEERAKLRQEEQQKRKEESIRMTEREKEELAAKRRKDVEIADDFHNRNYLQGYSLKIWYRRFSKLETVYFTVSKRSEDNMRHLVFRSLVNSFAITKERRESLIMKLQSLLESINHHFSQRLIIEALSANVLHYKRLSGNIARSSALCAANKALISMREVLNQRQIAEVECGAQLRKKLLSRRVFKQLQKNIEYTQIDRKIEERATKVVLEININEESLNSVFDDMFDVIWTTGAPQCRAFGDVVAGIGTDVMASEYAFMQE